MEEPTTSHSSTPPPGWQPWTTGSASAPKARGRHSQPPLEPLSRRLLALAGVLSALLILVAVNAWVRGDSNNPLNPNPIAAAAERAQRVSGIRMSMTAVYTYPGIGKTASMVAEGAINGTTELSSMHGKLRVPAPVGEVPFDGIGDADSFYMRSPLLAASLPPGKEWLLIEPDLDGIDEVGLDSNSSADGQLKMLENAGGEIEEIGTEAVRGVETTRYRGTVSFARFADHLRSEGKDRAADLYSRLAKDVGRDIGVEAWIDERGVLRQMRSTMSMLGEDGAVAMTMDMRVTFFDFGATPNISLPDESVTYAPDLSAGAPTSASVKPS